MYNITRGNVAPLRATLTLPIGTYGLEVKGTLNNNGWRTFVKCVLDITFATVRGDEEPVTPTSDYYDVTMEVQLLR